MSDISVLGLGRAGKNIADNFRQYSQYDVHTIDSEGVADYEIEPSNGVEGYERNYYSEIPDLYSSVESDRILFFLSGPGLISAAALPILQPFGDEREYSEVEERDISIVYVQPDITFLSRPQKKRERVTRNVLMQMSRSAVFERMFLISNPEIEKILGGIPVADYYEQINQIISYTLNTYYYFQNVEPIFGNVRESDEICRISTIGIIRDEEEKYFYPLKLIEEKEFCFSFQEEELKKNENLIRDLKKTMKEKREGEMEIAISYGIYELDEEYHICTANTSVDQSFDFLEEEYEWD